MKLNIKRYRGKWVQIIRVVQGYYSGSWEDVSASLDFTEANNDLKAYRENDPVHAYRMQRRYEELPEPPVKVVYRLLEGQPIAIFPELPANPGMMQSYMHLGQHAECASNITSFTQQAVYNKFKIFSETVANLHKELEGLGYVLYPIERMPAR